MKVVLTTLVTAGALALTAGAAAAGGTFSSSDPLLNRIWSASVRTATDMVAPGPLTTDAEGRPCSIALPQVLLDGYVRDRCPYAGDQAVTGMTLLVSTPSAAPVLHDMILWYASNQHADGAIPASPFQGGQVVFFDYNAFWVEDLYDYVLYTGDLALARQVWPALERLLDVWYPAQAGPGGLLADTLGPFDYAYIPRAGQTVAYYNAGYVRALRLAARIAGWIGEPAQAAAWTARIAPIAAAFGGAFWDAKAGAFRDATAGPVVHPEDGNAFAILAGLATRGQGRSALDYLTYHDNEPYGATIADNETWDGYPWGFQAGQRSYPFMSYFEVLARYAVGFDASALDLIRREWGDMLAHGPGTMWETIGPGGTAPLGPDGSWDHGWSSGAAPALTDEVLGITPAAPGFGSYSVAPHPSGLAWARGTVPTPHGTISFSWRRAGKTFTARVDAPVAGTISLPVQGVTTLDGTRVRASAAIHLSSGAHTVVVTS
jgi:Bacterial alpha-L-rhamnosidase C-terminal domain/Bacterial alpha-L-rhamnosidase 6 hairpin glycosidase domain